MKQIKKIKIAIIASLIVISTITQSAPSNGKLQSLIYLLLTHSPQIQKDPTTAINRLFNKIYAKNRTLNLAALEELAKLIVSTPKHSLRLHLHEDPAKTKKLLPLIHDLDLLHIFTVIPTIEKHSQLIQTFQNEEYFSPTSSTHQNSFEMIWPLISTINNQPINKLTANKLLQILEDLLLLFINNQIPNLEEKLLKFLTKKSNEQPFNMLQKLLYCAEILELPPAFSWQLIAPFITQLSQNFEQITNQPIFLKEKLCSITRFLGPTNKKLQWHKSSDNFPIYLPSNDDISHTVWISPNHKTIILALPGSLLFVLNSNGYYNAAITHYGHHNVKLAWHPESRHYLTTSNHKKNSAAKVTLNNLTTKEIATIINYPQTTITHPQFSPDGKLFAFFISPQKKIIRGYTWPSQSEERFQPEIPTEKIVDHLTWNNDGTLIIGSINHYLPTIHFWKSSTGKLISLIKKKESITHLTASPKNLIYIAPMGGKAALCSNKGKKILQFEQKNWWTTATSWNKNNNLLCTLLSNYTIKIWDTNTGELLQTINRLPQKILAARWTGTDKTLSLLSYHPTTYGQSNNTTNGLIHQEIWECIQLKPNDCILLNAWNQSKNRIQPDSKNGCYKTQQNQSTSNTNLWNPLLFKMMMNGCQQK